MFYSNVASSAFENHHSCACPTFAVDTNPSIDVSQPFQDTIGSTLRKPRVPSRDHKGKLAIHVSYHTPRESFDQTDKAAVVGKLVIQVKEKLGIGKDPDAQDADRAKTFLQSEEGIIWSEYIQKQGCISGRIADKYQ